jgi:serine/threonine protein kinase
MSTDGEHLHLIGQTVGKYRIASFLGEGGMAQVFVGEHVDPQIDRRVAIKVLRNEYCQSPQIVERFVNEARALGRINHPGVVEIFDVDRLPSGRVCMVMELLRGEVLYDYLAQRGHLPATEAVAIAGQIAEAIAAAHDQRIIHRDLKPENVFLHRNPDGVRVKVLDFGIAKLLDGAGGVQTATRSQLGTATYMSPEQFRSSRDVDHRSDIYSLGCVLFQMLAGRPPFVARNLVEQMRAHAFEPAPLLATVAPGAPPALGEVLARMLGKTREERFGSMREVQAALLAAIGGTGAPMGGVMTTGQYVAAAGSCSGSPSFSDVDPTTVDPPRGGAGSKRGLLIALLAVVVVAAVCTALAFAL